MVLLYIVHQFRGKCFILTYIYIYVFCMLLCLSNFRNFQTSADNFPLCKLYNLEYFVNGFKDMKTMFYIQIFAVLLVNKNKIVNYGYKLNVRDIYVYKVPNFLMYVKLSCKVMIFITVWHILLHIKCMCVFIYVN